MAEQRYLGDGIYASFDGWQIMLEANGTGAAATDRVYLDPDVYAELVRFVQDQREPVESVPIGEFEGEP